MRENKSRNFGIKRGRGGFDGENGKKEKESWGFHGGWKDF